MHISRSHAMSLAILIVSVLFTCEMPVVYAQTYVCCDTSVQAGTPGGINASPSVGTVSTYALTNGYNVHWCNCLSSTSSYSISEIGQATAGQECVEGGACYVRTESQATICSPTFGTPTTTPTSWTVYTTPYTLPANYFQCTDGSEPWAICSSRDWEVIGGCLAGAQNKHTYTEPPSSSCIGSSMNVQKKSDILVAVNREVESRETESQHEAGTASADIRYHCSVSSENMGHSSTSISSRKLECSSANASALSASVTPHADEKLFGHSPLYR